MRRTRQQSGGASQSSLGSGMGNLTLRRGVLLLVVAVVAAAVVVAATSGRTGEPSQAPSASPTTVATVAHPSTSTSTTLTTSTTLPAPPPLGWSPCGPDRQCSTLVVPVDYGQPG